MTDTQVQQASRRRLMKTLAAGGVMTTAAIQLPKQWAKPLVDIVLLPAHAQTSPPAPPPPPGPFELTATDVQSVVPAACSGGTFPPFDITGVFGLTGCSAATIISITPALPSPATMQPSFAVGGTVSNGTAFSLTIGSYPSSSQFVCQPPNETATVTIEYSCADIDNSPVQSLEINVLGVILAGQN